MALADERLEKYATNRRTTKHAESYAIKYDGALHKRVSSYFERRTIRKAVATTGLSSGKVLDVPCGAGRLTPLLAPVASTLVSVDYSPAMLKIHHSVHGKPCSVGSAFQLPFGDNAFDLVFSARLSHHISDNDEREKYVREILRVAGDWAIITIFDTGSLKNRLRDMRRKFTKKRPKNTFSRAEMDAIAKSAGYAIVKGIPLSRLASGHVFYVLRKA
jgi:ubiquinone/menaquinone biosynthesis C-methylase UbiE